jgi:hypothetical protein
MGKSTLSRNHYCSLLVRKHDGSRPTLETRPLSRLPTVAKGRNYGEYPAEPISFSDLVSGQVDCSYTEAIATIHQEMDRRYKLYEQGKSTGQRYTFILDEYFALARTHKKCSQNEVLSLICEARKVGLRLIIIVHSTNVKAFGWDGQGEFRKSLRWVLIG